MIKSQGPSNPKVLIVGDYATKEEEVNNFALSGKIGRWIDRFLWQQDPQHRLHLEDCYRTLYIRQAIPQAESKIIQHRKGAFSVALQSHDWKALLREEINQLKPNVIIALGDMALQGLTESSNIEKFRGSILPLSPRYKIKKSPRIIPTFHPRQIWKRWDSQVYVRLDYEKALRHQDNRSPLKEDYNIYIIRTYKGLYDYWQRQLKRKDEIPYYVTDVETYMGLITCCGFCFSWDEAISVPLWDPNISSLEKAAIWKLINKILLSNFWVVNQALRFDRWQYKRWGFSFRDDRVLGDTMLAGHTLHSELPKNLGFLTSIYTDMPYHKDEGKNFNPAITGDQLYLYNAKDCLSPWRIYKEMVEDMKETKIFSFYTNKVMPLFHVYTKIDERGIKVDLEKKKNLIVKYRLLLDTHQQFVDDIYGRALNVNSPKQVGTFIYDYLKCPKHTHTTPKGDEVYSTDKDLLEEIWINEIGKNDIRARILQEIITCRKILKLLEFLELQLVHSDGRLRTAHRLEGTKSGRTSGSKTSDPYLYIERQQLKTKVKEYLAWKNYGWPFQTIPKHGFKVGKEVYGNDILEIFVPSPGFAFVEGDGSAAEARVVSVLANDFETLKLLDKKEFIYNAHGCRDDLHVITATWTTGKEFRDIAKFDREDYGKRPRHAGNYDQGFFDLARVIHKSIEECKKILRSFHEKAPNIRRVFHREIRKLVQDGEPLITPQGRRREFYGRRTDKLYKEAYSVLPQATVSDHYKFSIQQIWDEIPDCFFLAEKHDSLLAEVPLDQVGKYCDVFKQVTERPINFKTCSIPRDYDLVIPCELTWSKDSWSKEMPKWKS